MIMARTFSLTFAFALLLSRPASSQESIDAAQPTVNFETIKNGVYGRITVRGDVPQLAPLLKERDIYGGQLHIEKNIPDESLIVGNDGGLANVFIYLRRKPDDIQFVPNHRSKTLESIGGRFAPHAQVIQTGQPLIIRNRDPSAHNVNFHPFINFIKSDVVNPPKRGDKFPEKTISLQVPEPIPILVTDDFYAWKRAYVLPLDHPFAAVTNIHGQFHIAGLPPGTYEFVCGTKKSDILTANSR